jgi:hypothetical protein
MTEHAQVGDDGRKARTLPDGRGAGDGLLSRRFFIDGYGRNYLAASDPRLAAKLYADKFALRQDRRAEAAKASMVQGRTTANQIPVGIVGADGARHPPDGGKMGAITRYVVRGSAFRLP